MKRNVNVLYTVSKVDIVHHNVMWQDSHALRDWAVIGERLNDPRSSRDQALVGSWEVIAPRLGGHHRHRRCSIGADFNTSTSRAEFRPTNGVSVRGLPHNTPRTHALRSAVQAQRVHPDHEASAG